MNRLSYTNMILTVIAVLLVLTFARKPEILAHAQNAPGQFTVKEISDPSISEGRDATTTSELNRVVGGKELVAIVPTHNGGMMVVLREQK